MKSNEKKLATVLAAFLLMATAMIPLTEDNDADVQEIFVSYGDDEEYEIVISTTVLLIGLAASAIAGGVAGGLIGYFSNPIHMDDYAGDQTTIFKEIMTSEAGKVIGMADTAQHMITTVLPADTSLWFFTTDAWQKAIEYYVSDNWTMKNDTNKTPYSEVQYNMQILSGLPNNAANYLYTWAAAIDNAYNNCLDYTVPLGQEPYATDAVLSFKAGSGLSISQPAKPTTSNQIVFDLTQFVQTSAAQNVYIDTSLYLSEEKSYCKSMYNFGSSAVTLTTSTGETITIQPGVNDFSTMTNFTPGVYQIPANSKIAGPLIPLGNTTGSTSSAEVRGCLVLKNQNTLTYFLPTSDGKLSMVNGGTTSTISSLSMHLEYTGNDGDIPTDSTILGDGVDIIGLYDKLIKQISSVSDATARAGKTLWMIFDECEEKNQFIKPSSLTINVPGRELTEEESVGLYIQGLQQIAEYGKTNNTELKSFSPNADSIGLICYGNIYYNGQLWAENAVFTPYTTTSNNTVSVGENQWSGKGFAMIWAEVDNFSDWNGQTSSSQYQLIDLDDKYTMDIRVMKEKSGQTMTSIQTKTLNKPTIEKSNTGGAEDYDPADGDKIKVMDANILMCLILVELGIILAFIGRDTGLIPLQIIAIIVILVGLMFPHIVSSIILGNFQWGDLMPFGWLIK